jgi:hypothetical protein
MRSVGHGSGLGRLEQDAFAPEAAVLLNLTELLLISVTPKGPQLDARAWGGTFTQSWPGFVAPPGPQALPAPQLEQLQPLFAALLRQQTQGLLFGRLAPSH